MLKIRIIWLSALKILIIWPFTDGSISDIQSPTKVYTFCQYCALFTKCTIM